MSRFLNYTHPSPSTATDPKVAQLTRHLTARIGEFFCAQIQAESGTLTVVFQGFSPVEVEKALRHRGVEVVHQEDSLMFYLTKDHNFEDIDFLWSILYSILV